MKSPAVCAAAVPSSPSVWSDSETKQNNEAPGCTAGRASGEGAAPDEHSAPDSPRWYRLRLDGFSTSLFAPAFNAESAEEAAARYWVNELPRRVQSVALTLTPHARFEMSKTLELPPPGAFSDLEAHVGVTLSNPLQVTHYTRLHPPGFTQPLPEEYARFAHDFTHLTPLTLAVQSRLEGQFDNAWLPAMTLTLGARLSPGVFWIQKRASTPSADTAAPTTQQGHTLRAALYSGVSVQGAHAIRFNVNVSGHFIQESHSAQPQKPWFEAQAALEKSLGAHSVALELHYDSGPAASRSQIQELHAEERHLAAGITAHFQEKRGATAHVGLEALWHVDDQDPLQFALSLGLTLPKIPGPQGYALSLGIQSGFNLNTSILFQGITLSYASASGAAAEHSGHHH